MVQTVRQCKVGLIVGEFFDGSLRLNNIWGGYGMLARHYIAQYLPTSDIMVETILGFNDKPELETAVLDGTKRVIWLPKRRPPFPMTGLRRISGAIIDRCHRQAIAQSLASFDVFLSIETMTYSPQIMNCSGRKKLILYVQDPRPASDWRELDTVIGTDDGSPRPDPMVSAFYRGLVEQGRLIVISQGTELIEKARVLYSLPETVPVRLVRNPIKVDREFDLSKQPKENAVVVLGRLDPVKRPWLALEVAKRMPQVQFYFLGEPDGGMMPYIIRPYTELPNVHLLGHRSGDDKLELLKRCKILMNTSIHEAIPVAFLEALSFGALIVSCQNPDRITERFGSYTGAVLGDGREEAHRFVDAIQSIVHDESRRRQVAIDAQKYATLEHNLEAWTETMRGIIRDAVAD